MADGRLVLEVGTGFLPRLSSNPPQPRNTDDINLRTGAESSQPTIYVSNLHGKVSPRSWDFDLFNVGIVAEVGRDRLFRQKADENGDVYIQDTTADRIGLGVAVTAHPLVTPRLGGLAEKLQLSQNISVNAIGVEAAAWANLVRIRAAVDRPGGGVDEGTGWSGHPLLFGLSATLRLVYLNFDHVGKIDRLQLIVGNRQSILFEGSRFGDDPNASLTGGWGILRGGEWTFDVAMNFEGP